ncbi:MAG TPA: threonine ammonia-lyase [Caulobacteraceae bacterium]|jgi:threonine dehydratase
MTLRFDDITAAAERIAGQVERTPLRRSPRLSKLTGAEVFVKYENQQFTGSFKDRGACNKLTLMSEADRARGVITASAGNHAQALACQAARCGARALIVMPEATPTVKMEQTKAFGAEILLEGETLDECQVRAFSIRDERGMIFVSAFNDWDIMAGQGTVGLEMIEDRPDLDCIVVPIGGGGLIAGIAAAAKGLKPDVEIVGVEAAMYPSFAARERGENKPPVGGQTIAEGIAVKRVGDLTYEAAASLIDHLMEVDEGRLEEAVALYVSHEKTVAEGAGAASLAALLEDPDRFRGRKVGLVLSGGNIDTRLLAGVLTRELVREHRIISLRVASDDRPGMLATITRVIGDCGGNIIDVAHNRLMLDLPAKTTAFNIMIETRGDAHGAQIVRSLAEHGYQPEVL